MRRISLVTAALILLPLAAHGETFTSARDILLPISIEIPHNVSIHLDTETALQAATGFRVIDSHGVAVAAEIRVNEEDLIPLAKFTSAPASADTIPLTSVEMMRDGDGGSAFQPSSERTFTFVLQFPKDITPTRLNYTMTSGLVESVRVRVGLSSSTLKNAFVGTPQGSSIALAGERARVVEITFTMREGVTRIAGMYLLQPRSTLVMRALPGQDYRFLYGAGTSVRNPYDREFNNNSTMEATLAPARPLQSVDSGDHDGVSVNTDNCPLLWNPAQEDRDADGIGDICDVCLAVNDPLQEDTDRDTIGNLCEDDDNDSIVNAVDNCPKVFNPEQEDEDRDGQGNRCDNVDNRFTAGKPWLLWTALSLIILMLGGAGAMVLGRTRKDV